MTNSVDFTLIIFFFSFHIFILFSESYIKTALTCCKYRLNITMGGMWSHEKHDVSLSTSMGKRDISLPNSRDSDKLAFVVLNVFTPDECAEWITLTESRGYSPALVNIGTREVLMTDFRNNDRCIIDDENMAKMLFERIQRFLPETWKEYKLVGLNERLRFLRYDPGQKFEAHMGKVLFLSTSLHFLQ